MRKSTTAWLITAALLILLGGIVFIGGMNVPEVDFRQVSTVRFETNCYTFEERIQHIAVKALTADIVFVPSESDTVTVGCHEQVNVRHAVTVGNGTLTITARDTRKWYEHISLFNLDNATITVALPKGVYGALTIDTTTGGVEIPRDFTFKTMVIAATTGDVVCTASVTDKMALHLTTGDIALANAQAGAADLSVTTGHIAVNGFICGGELSVKTGTGKTELTDVTCRSLTSSGTTGDLSLENVQSSMMGDTFLKKI